MYFWHDQDQIQVTSGLIFREVLALYTPLWKGTLLVMQWLRSWKKCEYFNSFTFTNYPQYFFLFHDCMHMCACLVYASVCVSACQREREFKVLSSNMIGSEDGACAILRLFFLCSFFFFHFHVKILLQDMLEMFVNKS